MARSINLGNACDVGVAPVVVVATATAATVAAASFCCCCCLRCDFSRAAAG